VSLPALAAAALLGNVAVAQLSALPAPAWYVVGVLVSLALLAVPCGRYAAVAVLAFFWTAAVAHRELDARWPYAASNEEIEVAGWIDDFPTLEPARAVFSLRVVHAGRPDVPGRLRLSWYDPPAGLAAGVSLALRVRLRAPRGLANPGGFDYERWLLVEGIGATGYVRSGVLDPRAARSLPQAWLGLRRNLAARLEAATADRSAAALLTALTLGIRTEFTAEQWAALRRTGTSHLVAISGLHVGLIATLVFVLARRLVLRLPPRAAERSLEIAAYASALSALAYAALAGFALPTLRALIMVLVAFTVTLSRRRTGLFSAFAIALLAILALDPLATLSSSFWLSFAAVGCLLSLASRHTLRTAPSTRPAAALGGLGRLVSLQFVVTAGLLPFVAAYFGEVSLVGPLVNCIAIPLFSLVLVPLALVAAAITWLGLPDPGVLGLAATLADLVWRGLGEIAAWPAAAIALPHAGALAMLVAGAAIVFALPVHPLPGRRLAWLALLPALAAPTSRPEAGAATALVLDVGHGLAVLVTTSRHTLLYDAGPLYRSGFDTGREIVVPALERRGVKALDRLMVSHADSDHAGGAPAVLAAYPAVDLVRGPDVTALGGASCAAGRHWRWDGVTFEILHPPAEFALRGNESSCVLKITTRGGSLLLTGDIEAEAERRLTAAPGRLRASVVVVPHHGSATSSSAAFVAAVAPELAVVSAGYANRWGFPKPAVRRRWLDAGARVIVTGEAGAVTIGLGSEGPAVVTERAAHPRYWRSETPTIPGESSTSAL
jgi:competence protein ComEC